MKFDKQRFRIAIYATSFFIFSLTAFTTLLLYQNENMPVESNCRIPVPFYLYETPKLDSISLKGKVLFNQACAVCHQLDIKSTGPKLKNIEAQTFWKLMDTLKKKNDSMKFRNLGIDYHRNLANKNFTNEELKSILEYLK